MCTFCVQVHSSFVSRKPYKRFSKNPVIEAMHLVMTIAHTCPARLRVGLVKPALYALTPVSCRAHQARDAVPARLLC
jgi:hypothetical protein